MAKRYASLRIREQRQDWLSLDDLVYQRDAYLRDCQARAFSPRTVANHRRVIGKLIRHLEEHEYTRCGREEVTGFLAQLGTRRTLKPATLRWYHSQCRAFFNWLVGYGEIAESPMTGMKPPVVREAPIQPFDGEQMQALMRAAASSRDATRNVAMLLLLYDTGIRASELCGLTIGDVDLIHQRAQVRGKGNKERMVYFGGETRRAMRTLIEEYRDPRYPDRPADPRQPVFCSNAGTTTGEALSRGGLHRIIATLGKRAGVEGVRCSPHTLRHTFALEFLRREGQPFALQQQMGHESLDQTRRYIHLAEGDLAEQHTRASPADHLFGRRRKR